VLCAVFQVRTRPAMKLGSLMSPRFGKLQNAQLPKTGRWVKSKSELGVGDRMTNLGLFESPDFGKLRILQLAEIGRTIDA